MKRRILLLGVLVGFLFSCEGPMGPPGESVSMVSEYIKVSPHDWEEIDTGNGYYFFCDVQMRSLDRYIYDNGLVMCYQIQNYNQNNEVQVPLPYVVHLGNEQDLWTETLSFDFRPGWVTLYFQYSDFYPNPPTEDLYFRAVLNW